jgi:hypothetical protein
MRDGDKAKQEHDSTLIRHRFNHTDSNTPLSVRVNPSILRLIEDQDKADTANLGPVYSLGH